MTFGFGDAFDEPEEWNLWGTRQASAPLTLYVPLNPDVEALQLDGTVLYRELSTARVRFDVDLTFEHKGNESIAGLRQRMIEVSHKALHHHQRLNPSSSKDAPTLENARTLVNALRDCRDEARGLLVERDAVLHGRQENDSEAYHLLVDLTQQLGEVADKMWEVRRSEYRSWDTYYGQCAMIDKHHVDARNLCKQLEAGDSSTSKELRVAIARVRLWLGIAQQCYKKALTTLAEEIETMQMVKRQFRILEGMVREIETWVDERQSQRRKSGIKRLRQCEEQARAALERLWRLGIMEPHSPASQRVEVQHCGGQIREARKQAAVIYDNGGRAVGGKKR